MDSPRSRRASEAAQRRAALASPEGREAVHGRGEGFKKSRAKQASAGVFLLIVFFVVRAVNRVERRKEREESERARREALDDLRRLRVGAPRPTGGATGAPARSPSWRGEVTLEDLTRAFAWLAGHAESGFGPAESKAALDRARALAWGDTATVDHDVRVTGGDVRVHVTLSAHGDSRFEAEARGPEAFLQALRPR